MGEGKIEIYEFGIPNLQLLWRNAKELCKAGEIPVKVKIVKIKKEE